MEVNTEITSPYGTVGNLPVQVADLVAWGRISTTLEDAIIQTCIRTATENLERYTYRAFVHQTRTLRMDAFKNNFSIFDRFLSEGMPIYVSGGKISAVTSIKFFDDDDAETLVDSANYYVDTEQGRIMPREGYSWPNTQRRLNAVEVIYTAGYTAAAAAIEEPIKTAIKITALSLYEDRAGECDDIPTRAKGIIKPYVFRKLGKPYAGLDYIAVNTNSGSTRGGY